MPLKLPSDEPFTKIGWLTGSQPSHEWFYVRADLYGDVVAGIRPTADPESYLSSNMPGFPLACSIHASLAGSATSYTAVRPSVCSWSPGQDVEVRAGFVRRTIDSTTGSSVDGGFRSCGLVQRVAGPHSIVADSGLVTEHVSRLNHYYFRVFAASADPDATLLFDVHRVKHLASGPSNGTSSLVAQHVITNGMSNLDSSAAMEVSFKVENVSGDVAITCKVYGYDVQNQPTEVTLFDDSVVGGTILLGTDVTESGGVVTDASADRILSGGGFGFFAPATRTDTVGSTGVDVTEGLSYIRVSSASSGGVLFEDDFDRLTVRNDALVGSDYSVVRLCTSLHSDVGAWINSLWSYGGCANTANTVADVDPLLDRSSTSAAVSMSETSPWPSDAPNDREFWCQRPSDLDHSHHRSIEFKPFDHQVAEPNWSTTSDIYGILLRGRAQKGYVDRAWCARLSCVVEDVAGVATQTGLLCLLSERIDNGIDGTPTYLDLWQADLQGVVDLLDGAWHSLDYDVHAYPDSTDETAPRIHVVKVDGTQVVFDTEKAPGSGTQALADGTIYDHSDSTTVGWLEGFVVESGLNQTDGSGNDLFLPAQVRNWTQETLTKKASTTVSPEDQESYAWVTDEGASDSTGDLLSVVTPTFPFSEEVVGSDMIEMMHDTGHRTTRARSTRSRRRYSFGCGVLDQSGVDALEAFWEDHGVEVPFDFQPDGESAARTCVFMTRPLLRMVGAGAWIPQVTIEELLP